MRVLITGATGFVGGWLAEELARAEPQARLWGTAHGPAPPRPLPDAVRVVPCDLGDPAAVRDVVALARPDRVFHLAGFASAAGGDRERIFDVNVRATVGLLEALAEAGGECRVLLASSGYVYGATERGRPAREDDAPRPVGVYAESKAAMEAAVRPLAGAALRLTVTRSFNHTGPGQGPDFVVPAFARQIAGIERGEAEPVVRVGNLEARRDFLHVRDVVRAYRLLLDGGVAAADWRVVNVASGVPVAIRAVLDELTAQARVKVSVETDPARVRPSDMPECAGDPSRLAALTGWRAETSLAETLAETLDWWRARPAAGR